MCMYWYPFSTKESGNFEETIQLDNQPHGKEGVTLTTSDLLNSNATTDEGETQPPTSPHLAFQEESNTITQQDNNITPQQGRISDIIGVRVLSWTVCIGLLWGKVDSWQKKKGNLQRRGF